MYNDEWTTTLWSVPGVIRRVAILSFSLTHHVVQTVFFHALVLSIFLLIILILLQYDKNFTFHKTKWKWAKEEKKWQMENGEFKWENLLTITQNDTIIITVQWESFCLAFTDKQKKNGNYWKAKRTLQLNICYEKIYFYSPT